MKAIEHIKEARNNLKAAREKSNLGTRLMLTDIIEKIDGLIERTENINDDNEQH